MSFTNKLDDIRRALADENIDGWLLYDYHHCNPLAYLVLDIPQDKMVTRRLMYWIPKVGEPIKIVPSIEPHTLVHLPGRELIYRGWQELEQCLSTLPLKGKRVAMEYSPNNALPAVSKVDAGTIDLVRKQGAEVVSSANMLQVYTSEWSTSQRKSHFKAADVLSEAVEAAWRWIAEALKAEREINEYQVQQLILEHIRDNGCETADAPICAVNAHSADPHYAPDAKKFAPIRPGDFILIDLWCKKKYASAVYADIARVGVAASQPTALQQEIFAIVKNARDAATLFVKERYARNEPIQGFQVDRVCREVIDKAGYGEFFIHRTGHNIGEEVHGFGANLDDLETHDFRRLIPKTAFSIEPGIYLPGKFGIRLEYDVYLDPSGEAIVTGGIQEQIRTLM